MSTALKEVDHCHDSMRDLSGMRPTSSTFEQPHPVMATDPLHLAPNTISVRNERDGDMGGGRNLVNLNSTWAGSMRENSAPRDPQD